MCDYAPARKDYLKIHMNKYHGIDLAMPCEHCNFQSKSVSILKTHARQKHQIQGAIFKYPNCSYRTFRRSRLYEHQTPKLCKKRANNSLTDLKIEMKNLEIPFPKLIFSLQ